ncbi:MAG: hypothetical protein LBR80_07890 [Deltaproteobacteria bacterium]|jgi:hypothetical protein|nr:hypothetical protein [Deltaproteobacteria bacterium]
MSEQVQDTQEVSQGYGISSTPAPPPGAFTASAMELAVRMGKLEAAVTGIREDISGIYKIIDKGFGDITAELVTQKGELGKIKKSIGHVWKALAFFAAALIALFVFIYA